MQDFDIERYLETGVQSVVKDIVKTSLFCPKETAFVAKFALSSKKANERRKAFSESGTHIPPFLIASITSKCNLHCAGCYARSLSTCEDGEPTCQLTADEWAKIFAEANELGISFILLAGGEPLVRRDVIKKAADTPDILFPIFTNGTMLNGEYLSLFDNHRNLVPIISIEGGKEQTDARRGNGVYNTVSEGMENMQKKHIAFGASVTLTKENYIEATSDEFIKDMAKKGCKAVIFVEFVPTSKGTEYLAFEDKEREEFDLRLRELRRKYDDMLFIAFPGDEKGSGGCLAAGRGFFHINSHGGAEPCPFSPYSDINVKNTSLLEAMHSKLFTTLREGEMLTGEHKGGCALYESRQKVEAILQGSK